MGWWKPRPNAALQALQAENSDLRAALRLEREQFAAERKQLLDRIMVLSAPTSYRELTRQPDVRKIQGSDELQPKVRHLHYPGDRPLTPPALPRRPPQISGTSITDNEAIALLGGEPPKESA